LEHQIKNCREKRYLLSRNFVWEHEMFDVPQDFFSIVFYINFFY
jgi:hypothetical protein